MTTSELGYCPEIARFIENHNGYPMDRNGNPSWRKVTDAELIRRAGIYDDAYVLGTIRKELKNRVEDRVFSVGQDAAAVTAARLATIAAITAKIG